MILCLSGFGSTTKLYSKPPEVITDAWQGFSFGYWSNGWRKGSKDDSPDTLFLETSHYGLLLDMDDLSRPLFGIFNDAKGYQQTLESGLDRLAEMEEASLAIEVEVNGTTYRAMTCKSGVSEGLKRLEDTPLWESGRYLEHFEVLGLVFRDDAGNPLEAFANLNLVAWPESLTLSAELSPSYPYADGPGEGVHQKGHIIIDQPLDIAHRPEIAPTQLTVESWIKFPKQLKRRNGWIVCKNQNEWVDGNYGFMLSRDGKHVTAIMNIGGGSTNSYKIPQHRELDGGIWHHLVLSYDGNLMSFYLNGKLEGTQEIGKQRVPGSGNLHIGKRADGERGIIQGVYDQFRIWNRALSEEEIIAHAKNPAEISSRQGLTYEQNFDDADPSDIPVAPVWNDAIMRIVLKAGDLEWRQQKQFEGEWTVGERHRVTLTCDMPGEIPVPDDVKVRVSSHSDQSFPVSFSELTNCFTVRVEDFKNTWKHLGRADRGAANNYDEFTIEVDNPSGTDLEIPFQFHMIHPAGISGLVPLLCDEDGRPTGIPVQLSKNWHQGIYLKAFTMLPAKVGVTRYTFRIVYGFYGTVPSASHSQLSLVGWGGNGRWDQLAIGSWGETFCLDMDMSPTDIAITDVRSLFLRNGKEGAMWTWSDGGWGGDWLGIRNPAGEKLAFSGLKTAYLAHGPCLTDVRYEGSYGSGPEVDLSATIRTLRTDDYARTFNTLRYRFNQEVDTAGAWLFKMGGGQYNTPTIAYGNRDGLIAEFAVPEDISDLTEFLPPVTLTGPGPWWVAYPGAFPDDGQSWGTGSRALVIRSYAASFGGERATHPTIAFPINHRYKKRDVNLHLIPPVGVDKFQPGDSVELDVDWIVVPRIADDYYGPNESLRAHLEEHPRSWKTIYREAVGNDLVVNVTGGTVTKRYPIIIETDKTVVEVKIEGGVGYVPIRFDGLPSDTHFSLYEIRDGIESKLDQSVHGNDFWQKDLDSVTGTQRLTFNIPLDGKETSQWLLKTD